PTPERLGQHVADGGHHRSASMLDDLPSERIPFGVAKCRRPHLLCPGIEVVQVSQPPPQASLGIDDRAPLLRDRRRVELPVAAGAREEEVTLPREVTVERPSFDAGEAGNVAHRRPPRPLLPVELDRCFHDSRPNLCLLLRAPPLLVLPCHLKIVAHRCVVICYEFATHCRAEKGRVTWRRG